MQKFDSFPYILLKMTLLSSGTNIFKIILSNKDSTFNCIFTIRGVDRYASSVFLDNVNNLITKILFLNMKKP